MQNLSSSYKALNFGWLCRVGIAVVTQGLVNIMKPDEVKKLFGTVEKGYLELSSLLATEMRS